MSIILPLMPTFLPGSHAGETPHCVGGGPLYIPTGKETKRGHPKPLKRDAVSGGGEGIDPSWGVCGGNGVRQPSVKKKNHSRPEPGGHPGDRKRGGNRARGGQPAGKKMKEVPNCLAPQKNQNRLVVSKCVNTEEGNGGGGSKTRVRFHLGRDDNVTGSRGLEEPKNFNQTKTPLMERGDKRWQMGS